MVMPNVGNKIQYLVLHFFRVIGIRFMTFTKLSQEVFLNLDSAA